VKTIDEILASARRPEDTVPICLRGDLNSRYLDLERRLPHAATAPSNLGERAEASVITEQMAELAEQMADSEVAFSLRALPPRQWLRFHATYPVKGKDETDDDYSDRLYEWGCKAVAMTCVEPVMTPEQVDELVPLLSTQQWMSLQNRSIMLNTGEVTVPFSVAASEPTPDSGPTSPRQPTSESASPGSSAPNRAARRRTSTTKKAASSGR